jgi:tetratricopeptide (TPR) repeat protein
MRRVDCQSDIVARSRRYPLSRDEQGQLEEHLAACAACRMALTVGADFDAIGGVRPGDGAFILGVADRLGRRGRARSGGLRAAARKVAVAAAAVFALLGAAAGAYALIDRHVPPPSPPAEAVLQRASRASPDEVEVVAKASPREGRVEAPEETVDVTPPRQRRHARVASRATASPVAVPAEDAALLFTHANTERRVGHSANAIALYDDLEKRYPDAQEAHAARVSLGKLLLASGYPGDALHQLDAYLAASPDGTLAPEALFGDAQALQQLGRKDDERTAWQRLVERFPYSVYTAQARRRLQDLR